MRLDGLSEMLGKGDWAAAETVLAPLAAAPGAHPSLVYNWGKVLIELGRTREAVVVLRKVVTAMPVHANAWFELGRAAMRHEDFPTAYEGFQRALALDPADLDARRNLGRVALRLGQWDVAKAAWEGFEADDEAEIALYRIAAETRSEDAGRKRRELLERHPDRAKAIMALVRTSKGAIPLDLRKRG